MKKAIALVLTAMILLTYSSSLTPLHSQTQYKVNVAVTLPYLSHVVKMVGGERVKVISLIPSTANPHSYEPPVNELISDLSKVDLIFMTGPSHLAIEKRIEELKNSGIIKANIIDYQNYEEFGLKLLKNPRTGLINPHGYVFSLSGLKAIAIAVAASLSKIDPEGSSYYKLRLDTYLQLLKDESLVCRQTKNLNVIIISPVLQYVVSDLGFNISYMLLPSVEVEPTQQDLSHLKELLSSERNALVIGSDVIISKDPKILQFLESINVKPIVIPVSKYSQSPELISAILINSVTQESRETTILNPEGIIGIKSSLLIVGLAVEAGVIAALFVLLFRWRKAVIEALCKSYEAGDRNE